MSLGLLLALVPWQAVGPQQSPLAGYDPARLHAEAVFAERAGGLLDAWLRADEATRERARAALAGSRRSGAPATSPPSLPALARALRATGGFDPATAAAPLQELADSLDLVATPGFFASRDEGLGELVTVRVRRLWPAPPPGDVLVSLWWQPPSGEREPVRARREPAAPSAFEGDGFEMFVRPPASQPGDWNLVVELEHGGERVRGVPVPVECVRDSAAAVGLAREALDEEGPALEVARGLLAAARGGARLPAGLRPSRSLELLRQRRAVRPGALPRPLERAFLERDGHQRWTWSWLPVEPPRVALVLIAPSHEPAQTIFEGGTGQLWRAAARELSALLLSSHLPRSGADAARLGEQLAHLHALARELGGDLPVVLVARGDSLGVVQRALGTCGVGFTALLAATPREGEPRLGPTGVPTLLLVPAGPEHATPVGDALEWVRGERELLLDEVLFPGAASAWLPARLAAASTGGDER